MTSTQFKTKLPLERGGALQKRTIWVLIAGTVLGGLGVGATLSVGALLIAEISGNDAISGLASAMFGAGAAIAGVPLARVAAKHGRRKAIVTGNAIAAVGALLAVVASVYYQTWLLILALGMVGVASAAQLLARFTATDLAKPTERARDLSLVVWSITVGAVVGPNLMGPGAWIGNTLGVTPLAGVFVFTFVAQVLAALITWTQLRPDPLLVARTLPAETDGVNIPGKQPVLTAGRGTQFLVVAIVAISQAVMVGLMAMTPLHLKHHGGSDQLVGITLSLHIAGMYAFSPVFGILASRFGRVPVIQGGWAILLVSAGMAYVAGDSHTITIIALFLLGLGWSAVTVAGASLVTDLTPSKDRTKRQGQTDTFMSGSGALAGALAGVGFAIGGFSLLSILTGVFVIIGSVVTVLVSLNYKRLEAAESQVPARENS